MPKLAGVILIAFLLVQRVHAQAPPLADTTNSPRLSAAIIAYNQSLDQTSILYNGREYFRFPPGIEGHGYLGVNDWQPAHITYNGISFTGIPALYDMVKDELVIRHYNGIFSMKLVKGQVAGFNMAKHRFIRVDADSSGSITPGFYELLYNGSSQVLAKRSKTIVERVATDRIESRFVQKNRYFVRFNNRFYAIDREGDLLSLFGNSRKTVQQYLRKNRLRFRKDPENTLVKATEYYDASKN